MTLGKLLKELNRDFNKIEYRTIRYLFGRDIDILHGFCKYINGELISLDGDYYSLNDVIVKYEIYRDDWLVVWYESEWISTEQGG